MLRYLTKPTLRDAIFAIASTRGGSGFLCDWYKAKNDEKLRYDIEKGKKQAGPK